MSQLSVQIDTPSQGAEVQRTIEVTGSISAQFAVGLTNKSVSVQFGEGVPFQAATFPTEWTWRCSGRPNASVPPGATITLTATADATVFHLQGNEDVRANTSVTVRIANPPSQVSIDPFPPPVSNTSPPEVSSAQLPVSFTLTGTTTSDPDANVSRVQMALDTGDFAPVDNLTGDWSRWNQTVSLSAGLHRFTVQALNTGGHVTTQEAFLDVRPIPTPPDPPPGSITSWTRLEPQCRNAEMGRSVGARLFDPLWMMARQWQMGEFQAVDAGTPVQARVRATSAMLSRGHFGELPTNTTVQVPRFDPLHAPLETVVERRRMRPLSLTDPSMLTFSVEAGLHFLHMLEQQPVTTSYRAAFIANYALQQLPDAFAAATDEATRRFVQTMAGRAPDARRLAAAFRGGGAAHVAQDPSLHIAAGDQAEVQQTALAWLGWYDSLFAEPANPADEAWNPSRMEYALTVSASFSDQPGDQINLAATEFDDGYLDWHSFDCDLKVNLGSNDHALAAVTETTVPAPVLFRGAPAVRFWELEESRLAYGLVPIGPTDLVQLMLIEYAGSYGNDWFVVPLTLPIGSINRVDSLVVTDSFGVRTLLRPIGTQGTVQAGFALWQHAALRRPGSDISEIIIDNLLFLPPTAGRSLEGTALEDVVFMRDEMANMAWAIERSIESPIEQPRVYALPPAGDTATQSGAAPRYLLASTVPDNWIPLLPVQLQTAPGTVISRLKPGAVLQPDGTHHVHRAQSQVLNVKTDVLLYDEDVPREGVHVRRTRNVARWIDGSTWVWTAFRKQVGRGEGSSGLRFDQLQE